MSYNRRINKIKEKGAKELHKLLCDYVIEANKNNIEKSKMQLYFDFEHRWERECRRLNLLHKNDVQFDKGAFKRMVDKKFASYSRKFFPEKVSLFKFVLLKLQKHSFES